MPDNLIDPSLTPFGVYADTGEFEQPIARRALMSSLLTQGVTDLLPLEILTNKVQSAKDHFDLKGGADYARKLKDAGWAVLWGNSATADHKKALNDLIRFRENEVSDPKLFHEFSDYVAGQTVAQWLAAAPRNIKELQTMQVVEPEKGLPYYLLIVASPEDIPFDFQCGLDLYWGVGRVWFSSIEEFGCYARSVIAYEKADTVDTTKELALFGTNREGDDASVALYKNVFQPWLNDKIGTKEEFGLRNIVGDKATKDALRNLWRGDGGTPALLFSGSHGLRHKWPPLSDADKITRQDLIASEQGALICQDWTAALNDQKKPIPPTADQYYPGRDVPADAKIHGMIHFMFACYGGGTPVMGLDENAQPKQLSPVPIMAKLPQALLGRENGALGVLAHVDAAWGYSYGEKSPQNATFADVLTRLMLGHRLGYATDQLNLRWAGRAVDLNESVASVSKGDGAFTSKQAASNWIARNDARSYIVLGDPAVRLRVDKMKSPTAT